MLFAIRSHRSHKKGCSSLPRICVRFIFERCTCDLNVCSQMWQWIKIWWRVGKVHGFLNVIINTGFHDHGALCNSLVSLHLWAYWGHSIGGIRGKLALVLHSSIKLAQKKNPQSICCHTFYTHSITAWEFFSATSILSFHHHTDFCSLAAVRELLWAFFYESWKAAWMEPGHESQRERSPAWKLFSR